MNHIESLKYTFNAEELATIARSLALANQEAEAIEDEKKEAVANFKARIEAQETAISRYARLYANGYEYRNVECEDLLNNPGNGRKTIVRKDTGEVVRTIEMTPDERQEKLPLEPPPDAEALPTPEPVQPPPTLVVAPEAKPALEPVDAFLLQISMKRKRVWFAIGTREKEPDGGFEIRYKAIVPGAELDGPELPMVFDSEMEAIEVGSKIVYRFMHASLTGQPRDARKQIQESMDALALHIPDLPGFLLELGENGGNEHAD